MRLFFRSAGLSILSALALCLGLACSPDPQATLEAGTDFQLQLSTASLSLPQGGQGSVGVRIGWLGDCGCPEVQLAVSGAPAGLDVQIDGNPTATGGTLLLRAGASLPPGAYRLRVTGARGALQHGQDLQVLVSAPGSDFTVTLNPAVLSVGQGGSATVGIEIQRSGGFAESIDLSLAGAPAGVDWTLSGTPLGPVYATPGAATLLLQVSPAAPAGAHTLTLTARSASRTRTAAFILAVQPVADFSLALAPPAVASSTGTGTSGPVTVAITRAAGFAAVVNVTLEGAPAGCTGSFTPAATSGNATSLTLSLANVAAGTYPMTVRGSAGAVSRTATLLLSVTAPPPDFGLPAATVTAPAGGSGSTGIVLNALNGFSAPVTLSASGLPAGTTASFAPNPATPASGSTLGLAVGAAVAPGTYGGTLRGVSGALDHSAALTLVVTPAVDFALAVAPTATLSLQVPVSGSSNGSRTIQVVPAGGFNAPVDFSAENLPAGVTASFSPNPATGSTTLFLAAGANALPGTSSVTIRGISGTLNRSTTLALTLTPAGDFTLALAPASGAVTIPFAATSTTTTSTVTLTPANGLSGSVALSVTGLPAGVTASFAPAAPALPGSAVLTLTIALGANPGTSTLTVHGLLGGLDRTATYTLTLLPPAAPDFTVTPQQAAVIEQPGTAGTMDVTVASVNGFSGPVNLAVLGLPAGASASFSPNPVVVPADGSALAMLSLNTSAATLGGVYNTTIQGTSGASVRSAAWQLRVQDFTLSASPNVFTFLGGGGISGSGTLGIARQVGLGNTISLSASAPPFTFTFTPSSTAGNSAGFSFTGPALAAAPPGTYTANLTGNAGTWTRTTPVTLNVQDFALTLMPSEHTNTGGIFSTQITVTRFGGLTGSVTPAPVTALYNSGFAPSPMSGSTATWTLTPATAIPNGSYVATVNGTYSTLTRSAPLISNVTSTADFYLHIANPGSGALQSVVTLAAGASTALNVVVNPVNGFTAAPTFSLTSPTGLLSATFTPPTTGGTTTMVLSAGAGLAPGSYLVEVVATYVSTVTLTRTAKLLVLVP